MLNEVYAKFTSRLVYVLFAHFKGYNFACKDFLPFHTLPFHLKLCRRFRQSNLNCLDPVFVKKYPSHSYINHRGWTPPSTISRCHS